MSMFKIIYRFIINIIYYVNFCSCSYRFDSLLNFYPYGNGRIEDSPIRDTGTSLYTKTELTTH